MKVTETGHRKKSQSYFKTEENREKYKMISLVSLS